jgi:hypothetical protein
VSFAEDLVQETLYTPAVSTDTSFISDAGADFAEENEETEGNSPEPGDGDVTPTNTSPKVWTKTASVSDVSDVSDDNDDNDDNDNDDDDDDLDALFAEASSQLASGSGSAALAELLDAGELESVTHVSQPHGADARASVPELVTEQVD